jgi:sporulation protein YlmC with PRC-barrel domain
MLETTPHDIHLLTGDRVTGPRGETLGKIERLMIDLDEGRVAYAVLSLGGIAGMEDKLFAVPWEALALDSTRQAFVLDIDLKQLESAPGFDRESAYPRLLWSQAPLGKAPIKMVNGMTHGRATRPQKSARRRADAKARTRPNMAFAELPPLRVHR